MKKYGRLIISPGARFLALGAAGAVFEHGNGIVSKIPIAHDLTDCDEEIIMSTRHREKYSSLCIDREKEIYQTLPKNENILDCLEITEQGLHFPYHKHGDLRTYLSGHQASEEIRARWIKNAIDAVAFIHQHGVVHADLGPRNFLVADDLSLKLCDFAGSVIVGEDMEEHAEEESRYRIDPWTPRCFGTDLFALGCFIYEVSSGVRPYDDVDDEEVARLYASRTFPDLNGVKYHEIIRKCWDCEYPAASLVQEDFACYELQATS